MSALTLEQQLDAIIAEHRLSSLTLTRINGSVGMFWSVNAQGDGFCGGSSYECPTASAAVEQAIANLNEKRTPAVAVPELVLMGQAA